jgi:hypothetical protein
MGPDRPRPEGIEGEDRDLMISLLYHIGGDAFLVWRLNDIFFMDRQTLISIMKRRSGKR